MEMAAELLLLFLVMSTFFIHFRPLQQSGQVPTDDLWPLRLNHQSCVVCK